MEEAVGVLPHVSRYMQERDGDLQRQGLEATLDLPALIVAGAVRPIGVIERPVHGLHETDELGVPFGRDVLSDCLVDDGADDGFLAIVLLVDLGIDGVESQQGLDGRHLAEQDVGGEFGLAPLAVSSKYRGRKRSAPRGPVNEAAPPTS